MKTPPVLAFALLALIAIAAAPAPAGMPAETAPELALPDLAPADPAGIGVPAPQLKIDPCIQQCLDIRRECDAGCSTTLCHRECRDSAIECSSHC